MSASFAPFRTERGKQFLGRGKDRLSDHAISALGMEIRTARDIQSPPARICRKRLRLIGSMVGMKAFYAVQPAVRKRIHERTARVPFQRNAPWCASDAMPPVAWMISTASCGVGRISEE